MSSSSGCSAAFRGTAWHAQPLASVPPPRAPRTFSTTLTTQSKASAAALPRHGSRWLPRSVQAKAAAAPRAQRAAHTEPTKQRKHHSLLAALCGFLATCCLGLQVACAAAPPAAAAAGLVEGSVQAEGNVPSQLSSAGEQQGPRLSSLLQGSSRRQVEGCTRRCVPTCIRGGEGAPGLGPISMRREIVVFKDGFRSRKYCLSECTQVCALLADNERPVEQQQGPE